MNDAKKDKPEGIDLTPKEKTPEGIVKDAESILTDRVVKRKSRTKGRRSKEELAIEKKLEAMAKEADVLLKASFAQLIGALTTQLAYITDDKKWKAVEDEQIALGNMFIGYFDMKFPKWRTKSPEAFLALGIAGFILPRFAIIEKQPIKDNPYKGWFRKILGKFKYNPKPKGIENLTKPEGSK